MSTAQVRTWSQDTTTYAAGALPMLLPLLVAYDKALARVRNGDQDPESGASLVEWVLITAVLVGIAVTVGLIIRNKLVTKSNSINFDTP